MEKALEAVLALLAGASEADATTMWAAYGREVVLGKEADEEATVRLQATAYLMAGGRV